MVVRPATTEQVAQVVRICHDARIPITPQGGNTGMVGGAVPFGGIILTTDRLNNIRELDADNATLIVEAGCLLADVQAAAPMLVPVPADPGIGGLQHRWQYCDQCRRQQYSPIWKHP